MKIPFLVARRVWRQAFAAAASLFSLAQANGAEEPAGGVRIPVKPTAAIDVKSYAADLVLHDLNRDGFLDLVVAANDSEKAAALLFVSERGRFEEPVWSAKNEGASGGAAIGDLDADGDADLVLAHYNYGPAVAYRNLGNSRFEREPFWTSGDTDGARGAAVADFDRDGHADIFLKGYASGHRIYRGTKDGLEAAPAWKLKGDSWASETVFRDVDRDGRDDLVMSSSQGPAFEVFRGLEKDFAREPFAAARHEGEYCGLAVADFDGDGYPEIAAGALPDRLGDGRVRLYRNVRGSPAGEPSWMSDDVDAGVRDLEFADLDRDGDLDLFVLAGEHTAAYAGDRGSLAGTPFWRAAIHGGGLAIADLDGNGYPDLVATSGGKVTFHNGGPEAPLVKAEPFPRPPELPPRPLVQALTVAEVKKLLKTAREAKSAPEIEAALRSLGTRAHAAAGAVAVLERDPEIRERAAAAVSSIAVDDDAAPVALEFLGLLLAPLTTTWKTRYALERAEGAVVLAVPDGVERKLGLGNLREGDVIVGVGGDGGVLPGSQVDSVKDPFELWLALIELGRKDGYADVEWVCGPLHPSVKGETRDEQLRLSREAWNGLALGDEDAVPRSRPRAALQGTVVVVDEKGGEHATEDGTLYLRFDSGASSYYQEAEVAGGKWRVRLEDFQDEPDLAVEAVSALLGGRIAYGEGAVPFPEDGVLAARLGVPPPTCLRVRGEDGADLSGIEVLSPAKHKRYSFPRSWMHTEVHPGRPAPSEFLVEEGRSPLVLRQEKEELGGGSYDNLWVRATGHAWAVTTIDWTEGGEQSMSLQRGGDLQVTFQGQPVPPQGFLRLESLAQEEKRRDRIEVALADGERGAAVTGLLPGRYSLSVEIGQRRRYVLAREEIDVEAGETAEAALHLEPSPLLATRVPLRGTLYLPLAWGTEVQLTIEPEDLPDGHALRLSVPLSGMTRLGGQPGFHRWTAGDVLPGRYQVEIEACAFRSRIDIGSRGDTAVAIEVPEPADVSLRLVDADSGAEVPAETIAWFASSSADLWSSRDVRRHSVSGLYGFRALAGEIRVSVDQDSFEPLEQDVEVQPGKNEVTVELVRAAGIRVRFILAGEEIHSADALPVEITGPGDVENVYSAGLAYVARVTQPGPYRVTFGPSEYYQPVAPVDVRVRPKDFAHLTVDLEEAESAVPTGEVLTQSEE